MDLERKIKKIEWAVQEFARRKYNCRDVFSFGATDIDPKYLAIWITTSTDSLRDTIKNDNDLKESVRDILRENDYPEDAIPFVGIAFESEETVKRDFDGNWWYAVK